MKASKAESQVNENDNASHDRKSYSEFVRIDPITGLATSDVLRIGDRT